MEDGGLEDKSLEMNERRPQTTDRLGGGGVGGDREQKQETNQRRNEAQSFLAWVAWLTLIERGWAERGRGATQ